MHKYLRFFGLVVLSSISYPALLSCSVYKSEGRKSFEDEAPQKLSPFRSTRCEFISKEDFMILMARSESTPLSADESPVLKTWKLTINQEEMWFLESTESSTDPICKVPSSPPF